MPRQTKQADDRRPRRTRQIVFWCISLAIILPGGYGFVAKFIEFIHTLRSDADGGFTIIPIMNYLLIAAGFTCLLVWAVIHGMFRDIEKPKYTMLEREAQLDRSEQENRSP